MRRERDVWLWGSKVVTTPSERAAFFAFADEQAVRTVYAESEGVIKTDPAALASFVSEAKARCIGVELLFGRSSWALASGHAAAIALAKSSVAFAAGLTGPRPLGVQALDATRKVYATAPAFGGFAVHHYESWKALGP